MARANHYIGFLRELRDFFRFFPVAVNYFHVVRQVRDEGELSTF